MYGNIWQYRARYGNMVQHRVYNKGLTLMAGDYLLGLAAAALGDAGSIFECIAAWLGHMARDSR
jgi:hypothetical protein